MWRRCGRWPVLIIYALMEPLAFIGAMGEAYRQLNAAHGVVLQAFAGHNFGGLTVPSVVRAAAAALGGRASVMTRSTML